MDKKVHIVSFDVPYPADYGGAQDVYFKIVELYQLGYKIYLHCFQYGRPNAAVLEKYCDKVWYYPRKTGIKGLSITLPYIVSSRIDSDLLQRLESIQAPILFEGAHCSYYAASNSLKQRLKVLRPHNIEYDYYNKLSSRATSFIQKLYFILESKLLYKYERQLTNIDAFVTVALTDKDFFEELYPNALHKHISCFHPFGEVDITSGSGSYILYHGNLSHPENIEVVHFLLDNIIPFVDFQFVIAGRQPAQSIVDKINLVSNCKLLANPSTEEMDKLIEQAHIHCIPTFQASGLKLKLLAALFRGRHVLVNNDMIFGAGIEHSVLNIANTKDDMLNELKRLIELPFTNEMIQQRVTALKPFSNKENAVKLHEVLSKAH